MAFISTSLSPAGPSTSTTSPTRFLCSASGHCVIRTTARSPVFPPLSRFFGTRISWTKSDSCVTRKAMSRSTRNLPVKVSFLRWRISVTIASLIWLRRRARNCTRTRSPVSADMELRSETKIGVPPSSGRKVFLPLALRWNVPSCTCPFVLSRYAYSPSLARKSFHAMSSMMSRASIFIGWVVRRRFLNTCFMLMVSPGRDWK